MGRERQADREDPITIDGRTMILVDRRRQMQLFHELAVLDLFLMDRTGRTVAIDARADDEKVPFVDPDAEAVRIGACEFDHNDDSFPFAVDVHVCVRLEAAVVGTPRKVGEKPIELSVKFVLTHAQRSFHG